MPTRYSQTYANQEEYLLSSKEISLDFNSTASIAVTKAAHASHPQPAFRASVSTGASILLPLHLKENGMPKVKSNRVEVAASAKPKQRAAKQTAAPVEIIIGKSKLKMAQPASPAASKQQIMISLLKRPKGAAIEELMEATGWQRHSVHGTMSGVLKKRLGLPLITEYGERGRTYRIADAR